MDSSWREVLGHFFDPKAQASCFSGNSLQEFDTAPRKNQS